MDRDIVIKKLQETSRTETSFKYSYFSPDFILPKVFDITLYGEISSNKLCTDDINKVTEYLKSLYPRSIEVYYKKNFDGILYNYLVLDDKLSIYYTLSYKTLGISIYFGDESKSKAENLHESLGKKFPPEKKFFINLVSVSATSNISLKGFEIKPKNISDDTLDLYYSDDIKEIDLTMTNFLSSKGSGLSLFHGSPGTGKTNYIRHLITKFSGKSIYVPGHLMQSIISAGFVEFLSNLAGSLIIIEDCEDILKPRKVGSDTDPCLSTILNMTDGLLSDQLELKFICTFNANLKEIDTALLRRGRLVCRKEFGKLPVDKVKKICEVNNLSLDNITSPMTLAEIFNQGKDFSIETNKIGFK